MKQLTNQEVIKYFGKFDYKEAKNGRIVILGDWVKKNIVCYKLPVVGFVQCHKEVIFDLFRIFLTVERFGLAKHVDVKDFRRQGGCFVPRHICWKPKNKLSRHSWGIAIDLNVNTNPYGSKGTMHKGIIKVFEDYGFLWGGAWRTPDPMHFEAGRKWQPFRPTQILPLQIKKAAVCIKRIC